MFEMLIQKNKIDFFFFEKSIILFLLTYGAGPEYMVGCVCVCMWVLGSGERNFQKAARWEKGSPSPGDHKAGWSDDGRHLQVTHTQAVFPRSLHVVHPRGGGHWGPPGKLQVL